MKILVVGDGVEIYSQAFFNAFKKRNYKVKEFNWNKYSSLKSLKVKSHMHKIHHKIQNKFLIGSMMRKINQDLLYEVTEFKPNFIFIYRGTYIFPETLSIIKRIGTILFGYHNDDPFKYKRLFLHKDRHYIKGLKYYDWIFAYRYKNIEDYKKLGYLNTSLLRSYYVSNQNFYIENIDNLSYKCDVLFVGHWEDDGRDRYLLDLVRSGIDVKLYGTEWHLSKYRNELKKFFGKIMPLRGEDYNLAINSTKIALVFLSKINNDTYTRRCFEIPATKTFMLSEYTEDMAQLFIEGKEAEYFRNYKELKKKIEYYLLHDKSRKNIAQNGYIRLMKDGHESIDRVNEIIKIYRKIRK